jgi:hypothetical protein
VEWFVVLSRDTARDENGRVDLCLALAAVLLQTLYPLYWIYLCKIANTKCLVLVHCYNARYGKLWYIEKNVWGGGAGLWCVLMCCDASSTNGLSSNTEHSKNSVSEKLLTGRSKVMLYILRHSVTASSWLAVRSHAVDKNVFDERNISNLDRSLLTFIEWIILNINAITSVYVIVTNSRQTHLASNHPKWQVCQYISTAKPTWCTFYSVY